MHQHQAIFDALFHISPAEYPGTTGLGILCGKYIFTCAHSYNYLPVGLHDVCLFDVKRVCDGAEATFAMYVATTMDAMILAPDGMNAGLADDDGPTSSATDVYYQFRDKHTPLRPAAISFRQGQKSVAVDGFFFAPDGKAMHRTQFHLDNNSPIIRFYYDDMPNGCSGGPLFTDDLKLIGIATSQSNRPVKNGLKECIGKRIDLCFPTYVHQELDWDVLPL